MTQDEWQAFTTFRESFKCKVGEWKSLYTDTLIPLQKKISQSFGVPEYPVENAVVYNRSLDEVTPQDDIKLIVIGDNPGKDEQREKNSRYLVGQAGKIAEGYFKKHPELGIDFRKNAVILNKTPVHSAKTAHLKKIVQEGGDPLQTLLSESQNYMAQETAALHCRLCAACQKNNAALPEIWLVGYSELGRKGLFADYFKTLLQTYDVLEMPQYRQKIFIFQHFSMNRFTIDLAEFMAEPQNTSLSLNDAIHKLGEKHREQIIERL